MKKYWIDKLKNTPLKGMQSVGREGAKVPVFTLRLYVALTLKKESKVFCGARGGRTLTMSPSTDFKSVASADSAIAPRSTYFIVFRYS